MALPTSRNVRPIDPAMTNLSLGFKNPSFLWDVVAPPVRVSEQTGQYPTYDRDYWFRRGGQIPDQGLRRAPNTPYQRAGYGITWTTYRTFERGIESPVDDVTKAASQLPDSLDVVAVQYATNILQLELELDVAAATFVTGIWGTTTTLTTTQWSDYDASDPIANADTAKRTIRRNTGTEPNVLIIGALSWEVLKEHPLILDKYKHTQTGILTEDLVAAALGIGSIRVGKSIQNTADQGIAFAGADIWTDNALFMVQTPTPGLMVPNGAYTFMWDEKRDAYPWAVESYYEDRVRGNVHRVFTHYVPSILSAQYGYIYLDTNA